MKKLFSAFMLMISLNAIAQNSGSRWKVQYVSDGSQMSNISSKKFDILLSIADKKIEGVIGCNKINGKLEYAKGDMIKPIKLSSNKENCPQLVDKAEVSVITALHTANKLTINQDKAKFYHGEKLVLELNR